MARTTLATGPDRATSEMHVWSRGLGHNLPEPRLQGEEQSAKRMQTSLRKSLRRPPARTRMGSVTCTRSAVKDLIE